MMEHKFNNTCIVDTISYANEPNSLKVESIEESKEGNGKHIILKGIFQQADKPNQNGRIYPKEFLNKNIRRLQERIKNGGVVAALDHPSDGSSRIRDAVGTIIELNEVDDQGYVRGAIKISNRTLGEHLTGLIESGFRPGISSRSYLIDKEKPGVIKKRDEATGKIYDVITDNVRLETFDVVTNQSVIDAIPDIYSEDNKGDLIMWKELLKQFFEENKDIDPKEFLSLIKSESKELYTAIREGINDELSSEIEKQVEERVKEELEKKEKEWNENFDKKVEEKVAEQEEELGELIENILTGMVGTLINTGVVSKEGQVDEDIFETAWQKYGGSQEGSVFGKRKAQGLRTTSESQEDQLDKEQLIEEIVTKVSEQFMKQIPGIKEAGLKAERDNFINRVTTIVGERDNSKEIIESVTKVYDASDNKESFTDKFVKQLVENTASLLESIKVTKTETDVNPNEGGQKGKIVTEDKTTSDNKQIDYVGAGAWF